MIVLTVWTSLENASRIYVMRFTLTSYAQRHAIGVSHSSRHSFDIKRALQNDRTDFRHACDTFTRGTIDDRSDYIWTRFKSNFSRFLLFTNRIRGLYRFVLSYLSRYETLKTLGWYICITCFSIYILLGESYFHSRILKFSLEIYLFFFSLSFL